jgi:hypothetical protein
MVVRVAEMSLRILFGLNLVLGLLFWFNLAGGGFVLLHMLIGILFVAAIWLLGLAQGMTKSGSLGLVIGTFVVGLIIAIFGLIQQGLLPNAAHWVIQVIHLLLAVAGIGIGEASAARYKRGVAAATNIPSAS